MLGNPDNKPDLYRALTITAIMWMSRILISYIHENLELQVQAFVPIPERIFLEDEGIPCVEPTEFSHICDPEPGGDGLCLENNHRGYITSGNPSVQIEGKSIAMVTSDCDCGSIMITGSKSVITGVCDSFDRVINGAFEKIIKYSGFRSHIERFYVKERIELIEKSIPISDIDNFNKNFDKDFIKKYSNLSLREQAYLFHPIFNFNIPTNTPISGNASGVVLFKNVVIRANP